MLTVAEMLRRKGVVGKFVEFFGEGLSALPVVDRTTISNMSPEFGSTVAIFPIDDRTLEYLRLTGRSAEQIALVEAYAKAQGLFRTDATPDPEFADTLSLDLGSGRAEPRRAAAAARSRAARGRKAVVRRRAHEWVAARERANGAISRFEDEGGGGTATIAQTVDEDLDDGSVVIAAITSCTNTSNPSVLIGAGLLARNAVERGLRTKSWVKTSLAPGSKVVTDYLAKAGLQEYLDRLGFNLIGYGCTTCIGNSGPLPSDVAEAVADADLIVAAVLSGNRNFEGRIHPQVRANYLASPPLVVAYALAGRIDVDLTTEPLGMEATASPSFLREIWPSNDDDRGDDGAMHQRGDVPARIRRRLQRRRELERVERCRERAICMGSGIRVREETAVLRRNAGAARQRCATCAGRERSRCWATRSRPTTSRPPEASREAARRQILDRATASSRAISTRTARDAATTK